MTRLMFFYNEYAAGYFVELESYPSCVGVYQYVAYRSFAHYQLWVDLREKGSAICSFMNTDGKRIEFLAQYRTGYGHITISKIHGQTLDRPKPLASRFSRFVLAAKMALVHFRTY